MTFEVEGAVNVNILALKRSMEFGRKKTPSVGSLKETVRHKCVHNSGGVGNLICHKRKFIEHPLKLTARREVDIAGQRSAEIAAEIVLEMTRKASDLDQRKKVN